MNDQAAITTDGMRGSRPGREATTGVNTPGGRGGPRRRKHGDTPEFTSYYGKPVLNQPVWESPDIPGYLFLGGLAGGSASIAAAAAMTGRPALSRVSKLGAAIAGNLSLVALVHDLGRPGRFLNMLRVFKLTSPMNVGSWLLAGFVPAASIAAATDVTRRFRPVGVAATATAALLGPPVASYTAALISDTAVPAWHDGYREMPFVFVSSAVAAATGLGLAAAPPHETEVLRPAAVGTAVCELGLMKLMEHRLGIVGDAYHEGPANVRLRAAEALTTAGAALVATGRGSRVRHALGGTALLVGSALTRFGIFEAGITSAQDPKYTVVPQRQRMDQPAS